MEVDVYGRQLHHLCSADDIALITSSVSQAERILTEFDETCECMGLQLYLKENDVHAKRMSLGCPNYAQRNDHIRMHHLLLSGSENEHEERSDTQAGQEETSTLRSL